MAELGKLIIVLGDQLSLDAILPDDYDPEHDQLWMAESGVEARRVWSHKARLVLFFSAMRHFRAQAREAGHTLIYRQSATASLADMLADDIRRLQPASICLTRPGDWEVLSALREMLEASGVAWHLREDPHFLTTPEDFSRWAHGRRQLRMEYFYREQRRRHAILMDGDGQPRGGRWNYDADNRASFGKDGPGTLPAPLAFEPDALTRDVLTEVEEHFSDHPGELAAFDWPVTRKQALQALDDFIHHRLPHFGRYQDAIWLGEPWLYHSRLAAALNLHLLKPQEVLDATEAALDEDRVPIAAAEGFIRQILGWREYVRGLYWLRMPRWREENHFAADQPLPSMYWTGKTTMACLQDAFDSTLRLGYAHHIQRLMVTGLFALLLGVRPNEIEAWYHAIYVDAVAWVELPNTLGMSQFVDGGVLASKPYLASGAYIKRMSNACKHCPYRPELRHGDKACPFTVLYWDFLLRHVDQLRTQPRLKMQLNNLARLDQTERSHIRDQARRIRTRLAAGEDVQVGN